MKSMRLTKNLSNKLDQNFRRQNIGNYKNIETAINDIYNYTRKHKNEEKNAHSANQIRYKNTDVETIIKHYLGRYKGIVVSSSGNGIEEVRDSRTSMDGENHDLLAERLLHDFLQTKNEIESVDKKFIEINFDTYFPDKTGKKPMGDLIQKALDDIGKSEAGTLYIKNGTYLINRRLYIPSNTTIKMESNTVLLRGHAGGFFDNGDPNANTRGYEGPGNIHIIGGTLDNNYEEIDKYPTKQVNMINLRHADNVTFTDMTFKNSISNHVFDVNGTRNLKILNCKFEGYINLNGKPSAQAEAIQLSEYIPGGINGGIVDGTPTCDVLIENCKFSRSNQLGGFDTCIGNHITAHNVFNENIEINNNTFEDCYIGVRPYKWNIVKMTDNIFVENDECIRISSVGGNYGASASDINGVPSGKSQAGNLYTIRGNTFRNYKTTAIGAYGQEYEDSRGYVGNLHIKDNTFLCDNNDKGVNIDVVLCRNIHIKDNSMEYARRGIQIMACHNIYIDKNHIEHMKTEGIYLRVSVYSGYAMQTRHLHVTNNTINTTGRNGYFFQNTQNLYILSNSVSNTNEAQEGNALRGGIYLNKVQDARIENNDVWGTKKDFVIRGSDLTGVIAFNNGGQGEVKMWGDNAIVGYYNVASDDNIYRYETKAKG